jgi:hypothetical protein
MEQPRLIEPNVKNYLFDTLHRCHIHKTTIHSWMFNISIFLIFVFVIGSVLYFCRKRKLTPYEKEDKMRKEQDYVLSKIRQYQMDQKARKSSSSITNLPFTYKPEII